MAKKRGPKVLWYCEAFDYVAPRRFAVRDRCHWANANEFGCCQDCPGPVKYARADK